MKPHSRRNWPLVALLIVPLVTLGLLALRAQRAEYGVINASLQRIEIVQKVMLAEINHITYVVDSPPPVATRTAPTAVRQAKPRTVKPNPVTISAAGSGYTVGSSGTLSPPPPCRCKCSK